MKNILNKIGKFFEQICVGIISIIFLISIGTIFIVNFRGLYYFDINYLDIPAMSGLESEEIRENYDALIDYNMIFFTGKLEFPSLEMSESGEQHFAEVKHIFNIMYGLAIITFIILIFVFPRVMKKNNGSMKTAAVLIAGLPVALAVYILCNFDKAFVLFHSLLFNNNYWIFNERTDPVIKILPEEYFMHCGIGVLLFAVVGGIALFIVSIVNKKKIRKKNK